MELLRQEKKDLSEAINSVAVQFSLNEEATGVFKNHIDEMTSNRKIIKGLSVVKLELITIIFEDNNSIKIKEVLDNNKK